MKKCLCCGATVGVDVQTCPNDGEASWGVSTPDVSAPKEVLAPKRGPGRPKK